jgi:hypothetical protein
MSIFKNEKKNQPALTQDVIEHQNDKVCLKRKNMSKESESFETISIDNVNHPSYYTSHPSGVECIEITRHYCFAIGSAIKYLWRAGLKKEEGLSDREKEIEDLEKAVWFIKDRIEQLKKESNG